MPWRPRRKRKPFDDRAQPGTVTPTAGGCGAIEHRRQDEAPKLATSSQYTKLTPAPASSRPASAGPTTEPHLEQGLEHGVGGRDLVGARPGWG